MRAYLAVFSILLCGSTLALAADQPETRPLDFVSEYIRQLGAVERISAMWRQPASSDDQTEMLSNTIYFTTALQLELNADIRAIKRMRFKPPNDELLHNLVITYEQKVALLQQLGEVSTAFLGGPKPGVDYKALAAEIPQIRARLDFIDRTTVEDMAPLVSLTLLDLREDSHQRVTHLIITKAEREKLMDDMALLFGPKLDEKNPYFTVAAAIILKGFLTAHKCSDEPWQ
jgi:hypothetical protein